MSINMKIVYIYHSFIFKGGIERVFCDKMNYLAKNTNYDISFITFEQGTHPYAYDLDKRVKVIDINCRFAELWKYSIIKRSILKFFLKRKTKRCLSETLKKERPDIVISTTAEFENNECILDLPYRFIVESHTCLNGITKNHSNKSLISRYFWKAIDKWHFSKIDKSKAFVTLTNADKTDWAKYIKPNIYVIPNMVTCYPDKIIQYSNRKKRILCVSRLDKIKRFDLMIKAWSLIANKNRQWRVDIFGDGEMRQTLDNLISIQHLNDSITIHPSSNRIYDEYMDSSIFAFSSELEGFGLVLIEAMSCGVPCVSFDCPNGPAEIISHGKDGLLVKNGDVNKFAETLDWMINHDEEREIMSKNARIAAQRYHKDTIMPQWIELFNTFSNTNCI